jgi:hypothetical protein
MEQDAVQLIRRKTGRAALVTAASLAVMTLTGGTAWADASAVAPGSGPQLILSTYYGNVYTMDPANKTDACQSVPVGDSVWAADSPVTIAPDDTVYTSSWATSSDLAAVGTYSPASSTWANASTQVGSPAPDDIAGLLAQDNTMGVATSYYSEQLFTVDFKDGSYTNIGDLPAGPGDGLAWAPNGDLLMVSTGNELYRLPAATLTGAEDGGPQIRESDWMDLGTIVTQSPARWYNPLTWGSAGYGRVYGLATGPDGHLYLADKGGQVYDLASIPATPDPSRTIQGVKIRDLNEGCGFTGPTITGLSVDGQWLWAPADTDTPQDVSAVAGQPISGTVSSSMVKAPVNVIADASTLPAGVSIGADGTISGTPVTAGASTVHVKVCGQDTCVWRDVDIAVGSTPASSQQTGTPNAGQKPPPADPTMTLNGSANAPISGSLPGNAAAAPSTFTVTDPTQLPQGVSIDSSGNLMGIPASAGSYAIPVKACNATGCTTGTVTLTIGPDQSPCDQNPSSQPSPTDSDSSSSDSSSSDSSASASSSSSSSATVSAPVHVHTRIVYLP